MTTIVCDGRTVASDSAVICNGLRVVPHDCKKIVERRGYVFGIVGEVKMLEPMIAWFLGGAKKDNYPPGKNDYQFLVFYRDRVVAYDESGVLGDDYLYPATFGSGRQVARGALQVGATAETACAAACALDMGSAEPVITLELSDLNSLDHSPARPAARRRRGSKRRRSR